MILTVIELDAQCPLRRLDGWLHEAHDALDVRTVRAWAGEPVPGPETLGDGLVVLGGPMNAYDDDAPGLVATRELLARTPVPTLAICLGAQLLAVAHGGRVHVDAPPGREAGVIEVHPRPEAADDALLGPLAAHVVADHPLAGGVLALMPSMHADAVVDLPADATWLASSRLYPYQAFRVGDRAWGLQFHPEADEDVLLTWARLDPAVDVEVVRAQARAHDDDVRRSGRALAHGFVRVMADRARTPAPV